MKKKAILCIVGILLVSIGYTLYPVLLRRSFERYVDETIQQFYESIEALREEYRQAAIANPHNPGNIYDPMERLHHRCIVFNWNMYFDSQIHLYDPFNFYHVNFNLQQLGQDMDMVGYITIPTISLRLPVFLGTSHQNLNRGAAHLTHSSLPVGGQSSNAIIVAHRRVNHAPMFRDIGDLTLGDEITVTHFYGEIVYEVVEIRIISPQDVGTLTVQSDRNIITLLTQHPRRRANMRLLVIAEAWD